MEISLIGTVVGSPRLRTTKGSERTEFSVRAECSPPTPERTAFTLTVCSPGASLLGSVASGTRVYVSGLLSLGEGEGGTAARVEPLTVAVLGERADAEAELDRMFGVERKA